MVTIYWVLFGAAVVYLYVLIARERDRRARIRRLRQRRERRRWLDSQQPKPWDYR